MYNRGLMNPLLLGVLCGVVFGVAYVLMTVFGNHPDVNRSVLMQAFTSRLAIAVLGANVSLGVGRVRSRSIDKAADQPA